MKKIFAAILELLMIVSCNSGNNNQNTVVGEYFDYINQYDALHEKGDTKGIEKLNEEISRFIEENKDYVLTEKDKQTIALNVITLTMRFNNEMDSITEGSPEAKFWESLMKTLIYGTSVEKPVTFGDLAKTEGMSMEEILDMFKSETGLTGEEEIDDETLVNRIQNR